MSESDEDCEEELDDLYDSLVQMEYDDIINQKKEEYQRKKQAIAIDNFCYAFAPIPEKKKSNCLKKDEMRQLVRKLRSNYRDNKVIDRSRPTF